MNEEVPGIKLLLNFEKLSASDVIELLIALNDVAKETGIDTLVAKEIAISPEERAEYEAYFKQFPNSKSTLAKYTSRECAYQMIEKYGQPQHYASLKQKFEKAFPEELCGEAPLPKKPLVTFFVSSLEYLTEFNSEWVANKKY